MCSQGYQLVGSATRVCRDNGTWSGINVICKGEPCWQVCSSRLQTFSHWVQSVLKFWFTLGSARFSQNEWDIFHIIIGERAHKKGGGPFTKMFGRWSDNPSVCCISNGPVRFLLFQWRRLVTAQCLPLAWEATFDRLHCHLASCNVKLNSHQSQLGAERSL